MVIGKHFSKYYLKYWFTFLIGMLSLVLVDYFQLVIPDVVGDIVDGIAAGEKGEAGFLTREVLLGYILELLVVVFVVFIGRFLWRICIFGNGIKIETDIRNEMFRHMEKLSTTYYSKNKTGALMALYTNDLATIRRSFGGGTLMLVDAVSLGILAFIKMFRMSGKLSLLCLIPLVIVGTFATLMRSKISKKVKRNLEAFSSLSDYVQEDFSGINVIKAYVKEKRKEFLFKRYNQENMDTCIDFVKYQVFVQVTINTILSIIMISIIFFGGVLIYQAQTGNIVTTFTVGKLTTFNAYFGSLIWPVMAIGDLINLRGQSKASEKRISDLLDAEVEINDDGVEYDVQRNDIKGTIEFKNVDFKYPLSEVTTLSDVSFKINAGEMVGIMGPTGCGKTTIVELLLRIYNLENDKVLIDGMDIMKMPIKTVRDVISYVPQETFLFKQTIEENISFSSDEVDKEKNHIAAYNAGIAKDIEEFKHKYDTVLGERGVTVSGGQKQRISIARALMKDAPILILDDSLSAVDTITEKHVLERLREIRKNKTTIIIAHRITTLETLDKIIVVDDGKILNIGTHEELLHTSSLYQKEVKLQELEKEVEGR